MVDQKRRSDPEIPSIQHLHSLGAPSNIGVRQRRILVFGL
jgi:hypothetical protein